jgi:hypothetical protein
MRRTIAIVLVAGLCLGRATFSLAAEEQAAKGSGDKPQFAYNIFSAWVDDYVANAKRGKAVASGILFTTSALTLAGAGTVWFAGDAISRNATGYPMDLGAKQGWTLGLGIAGTACLIPAIIVAASPIKDYRSIYADVFQEKDPEVQEAMAASVLRYQSDKGKESRLTGAVLGLAVPLVAGGFRVAANVSSGTNWSTGVWSSLGSASWSLVFSAVSLFTKSEEERRYDRYLQARDAYYGTNR